jgi:hypothetical protein
MFAEHVTGDFRATGQIGETILAFLLFFLQYLVGKLSNLCDLCLIHLAVCTVHWMIPKWQDEWSECLERNQVGKQYNQRTACFSGLFDCTA